MNYINIALTLAVAVLGMYVFTKLKVPAGAMIGSMLFVATLGVLTGRAEVFPWFKYLMQICSGILIGSKINRKTLSRLKNLWKVFLAVVVMLILETAIFGILYFKLTDYDIVSCIFSIAPGGATDLTILSAEFGAVSAIVGVMHVFRQIMIIIILPPIAFKIGSPEEKIAADNSKVPVRYPDIAIVACCAAVVGFTFKRLGVTAPIMLGSILAGSVFTIGFREYRMPSFYSKILMTGVGAYTGSMVTRQIVSSMGQMWVGMVLIVVLILVTLFLNSLVIEKLFKMPKLTSMYLCAPGGLSELTLLAEETGGDLPTIAAIQTARMLTVVLLVTSMVPFMQRIAEII
jgi:membrane AbrB-like protein